jgi:hypothetical protein
MSLSYELWQAERKKTKAEQREIDRIMGQVVAALVELWHLPGDRLGMLRHPQPTRPAEPVDPGPIALPAQRAVPVGAERVSPFGAQAEVSCDA